MIDTSRSGGSNGTRSSLDPKILRRFLHCPGSAPRQASACKWTIEEDRLVVVYISPYETEPVPKAYKYPLPFRSGQIQWTVKALNRLHSAGDKAMEVMELFTMSKVLSVALFSATNTLVSTHGWLGLWRSANKKLATKEPPPILCSWLAGHGNNLIATEATNAEHARMESMSQRVGTSSPFVSFLYEVLQNCYTTALADAVGFHRDKSKRDKKTKKHVPFVENKMLFQVPFMSTYDKDDPPLGRGGAGPGVFVFAGTLPQCFEDFFPLRNPLTHSLPYPVLDHSFKERTGRNYRDYAQQQGIDIPHRDFAQMVNGNRAPQNVAEQRALTRYRHLTGTEA